MAEAVVIAEEKLAYLKVDSKTFDAAMAASLAGASYAYYAEFLPSDKFQTAKRIARILAAPGTP